MKIRNNSVRNIHLRARHEFVVGKDGQKKLAGLPDRLAIPAGATLEVDDKAWPAFDGDVVQGNVECGNLTILLAAKLSREEQATKDEADLKAAQATVTRLGVGKKLDLKPKDE